MARKKKEKVVENPETETVVDTVEVTEPEVEVTNNELKVDGTVATVLRGSFTARTYTKEKHGDNFVELAREYAKNNGGEVVIR